MIRALEVFETTGYSIMAPKETPACLYDYYMIGLDTEREFLYSRINQRVDQMLAEGLIAEARKVYELGAVQASQGIGYKEFFPYFEENITLDEAVEQIKLNSRRYAKRQLTWFRNRLTAHWFDLLKKPTDLAEIENAIEGWLKEVGT